MFCFQLKGTLTCPCCLAVRRGACSPSSGRLGCNSSAQLGRPMLPAFVNAGAGLGSGGQRKSAALCQSDGHIRSLLHSPPDSIGGPAGWTMTSSGWRWVCVSGASPVRATHVHMWCPYGCPGHARVGLQAKCWTSPPPWPAQRRRVACDAACSGAILQGTGGPQ